MQCFDGARVIERRFERLCKCRGVCKFESTNAARRAFDLRVELQGASLVYRDALRVTLGEVVLEAGEGEPAPAAAGRDDGRGTFGHYVEFVWASEAGWKMVGWPEGRPTI